MAGDTVLRLVGVVLILSNSRAEQTSSCIVKTNREQSTPSVVVHCKGLNLTSVPKLLFTEKVVDLDLSMNQLQILRDSEFRSFCNLKKLNISQSGIIQLSANTFEGLDLLEELDIKNNPILAHGLPEGLFKATPILRRLSASGYARTANDWSELAQLNNLEEIAISLDWRRMPYGLAKLPKLRVLYFVFCYGNGTLTRSLFRPFAGTNIEQLAFIHCNLVEIENGVFEGFSSLDVLNVVGNYYLKLDDVIDALSTSENASVSTLIADLVGYKREMIALGKHDYPVCRKAWHHLKRLSLRGVGLLKLGEHFVSCLENLEALSVGFNRLMWMKWNRWTLLRALVSVELLDVSYFGSPFRQLLKTFNGIHYSMNWIKRNEDYFLPPLASSLKSATSTTAMSSGTEVMDNCTRVSIPPKLEYLIADRVMEDFHISRSERCYRAFPNRLRFFSLTNTLRDSATPVTYNLAIYGLDSLEVFNLSGIGYLQFNWDSVASWRSLRVLNLADNVLGLQETSALPPIRKLEDLDLSNNMFKSFPVNMFANLRALVRLNLASNRLDYLNFELPDTLRYLDLSKNILISVGASAQDVLRPLPDLVVDLRDNPFYCDCEEADFIHWFQETSTKIVDKRAITCRKSGSAYNIDEVNVTQLKLKCSMTINSYAIIGIVCGFLVLSIIGVLTLYRCWYVPVKRYAVLI